MICGTELVDKAVKLGKGVYELSVASLQGGRVGSVKIDSSSSAFSILHGPSEVSQLNSYVLGKLLSGVYSFAFILNNRNFAIIE